MWLPSLFLPSLQSVYSKFRVLKTQVSAESLVDISQYIEGEAVRICLEQFSDMSQFVFALVVHPPTPSQLQNAKNLSNNRLKDRIRITYEDVFGHVH